jgi:GT2 family glycosyltransferase
MITPKICIVTATREKTFEDFKTNTLLGKSLSIQTHFDIQIECFIDNKEGLSKVYNDAINRVHQQTDIIVFAHDDVALLDYYWPIRVVEALNTYDIVGVAGNSRHKINYPSWAHSHVENGNLVWDDEKYLSGSILHDSTWPPKIVSVYGDLNKEVVNLDGVFIATKSKLLSEKELIFDERFKFHFYDADFSKNAVTKGCKLGTFPLALLHAGKGNMNAPEYIVAYKEFNRKWNNES